MEIRLLTRDDAAAFRDFRLVGLRNHPEAFGESAREWAALTPEEIAARMPAPGDISEGFIVGAYDNGRLVGITCLMRSQHLKKRHHAELWGMHVAADMRRRGIGERLVNELIAHARTIDGLDMVYLTAATVNERAWKLYEKSGFTIYGTEPKALRIDGVDYDQHHMILDLSKLS
ncbi:MAG: GNAT family N-acetyltransferase [candidate division Zixibacteria bacterium]|nr:GNAT family N-acetyltransferase [candidate division Zixibacteria bacterium]